MLPWMQEGGKSVSMCVSVRCLAQVMRLNLCVREVRWLLGHDPFYTTIMSHEDHRLFSASVDAMSCQVLKAPSGFALASQI